MIEEKLRIMNYRVKEPPLTHLSFEVSANFGLDGCKALTYNRNKMPQNSNLSARNLARIQEFKLERIANSVERTILEDRDESLISSNMNSHNPNQ